MSTMTIDPASAAPSATSQVVVLNVGSATADVSLVDEPGVRLTVPSSVPRSQLYYWRARWQENERAAAAEREQGLARTFDDAHDLLAWLFDGNED